LGGKTVIGMTLRRRDGQKVAGSYFYKRYLKDIPLSGEFTGDRDLTLHEVDGKGQAQGTFALQFAEHVRAGGGVGTQRLPWMC
jgi:hypothetical protein